RLDPCQHGNRVLGPCRNRLRQGDYVDQWCTERVELVRPATGDGFNRRRVLYQPVDAQIRRICYMTRSKDLVMICWFRRMPNYWFGVRRSIGDRWFGVCRSIVSLQWFTICRTIGWVGCIVNQLEHGVLSG